MDAGSEIESEGENGATEVDISCRKLSKGSMKASSWSSRCADNVLY